MLKDLVLKNRSYRSFSSDVKITKEEILDMIDLARITPSAMNLQPLRYKICVSEKECATLLSLTSWAGRLRPLTLPPKGHEPTAFIVICTDKNIVPKKESAWRDIGISAQTILLRAAEMGFGGCMLGAFSSEQVSEALSIDDSYDPTLIIGLGKPDETVELEELIGENTSYYRTEDGTHHVPKRKLEDIII